MPTDPAVSFATALCAMQGEFKTIVAKQTVTVKTTKGSYQYDFAPYDHILDFARPIMKKHGFAIINITDVIDGKLLLKTLLLHSSGESMSSTIPVKVSGNPQDLGSELSYMKRYQTTGILGLATNSEDDDANPERRQPDAAPSPARAKSGKAKATGGDDPATKRTKALWTQLRQTAKALGLDTIEGENFMRDKMQEMFGDREKSTKTLEFDEFKALIELLQDVETNAEPIPGDEPPESS
jgi:hypothetical protein